MVNKEIKIALIDNGMFQYELAELMGIHEFSLSRKLRKELPNEEKLQIIKLIKKGSDKNG